MPNLHFAPFARLSHTCGNLIWEWTCRLDQTKGCFVTYFPLNMHRAHSIYNMAELNVFSGVGFSMQMLIKLHSHRVSQGVAMTTSYAVEVPFATERRPCQNCGESNRAEASLVGKIRWKRGVPELRWLYLEFCIKSVPFIIRAPFFFF